jgi:FtsZ-binding cell division protein ZapB
MNTMPSDKEILQKLMEENSRLRQENEELRRENEELREELGKDKKRIQGIQRKTP